MGLAQLGLSVVKMKTARRKKLNDPFSTTERIEQSRVLEINCSSVVVVFFWYVKPFPAVSLLLSLLWYALTLTVLVL